MHSPYLPDLEEPSENRQGRLSGPADTPILVSPALVSQPIVTDSESTSDSSSDPGSFSDTGSEGPVSRLRPPAPDCMVFGLCRGTLPGGGPF